MASTDKAVRKVDDLTTEWLSAALGSSRVASFTAKRIGTGQLSDCYRVELEYADDGGETRPKSVILKVAAEEETSRKSGVSLGLYQREVEFYNHVAPSLGDGVPACYHASFEGDAFALLLGDASPATVGNELSGATVEEARLAVTALGKIHRSALGNTTWAAKFTRDPPPMNQGLLGVMLTAFVERYKERVKPEHRLVCEKLAACYDAYMEASQKVDIVNGLIHGDYRLDNLLFGEADSDRPITAVDWQTIGWGHPLSDLSYFLGCALSNENRRTHSDELVRLYHTSLGQDSPISLEQCFDGVRLQAFFGVVMAIVSPIFATQTERGDDMFMTLLDRHCTHVLDLHSLDVLPQPVALKPLRPAPEDELPHCPGEEDLWNESWYFDVADTKVGLGAYVRLGTYPNQKCSWYTAVICGPGKPTIAVLDFEAPLPDKDLKIQTATVNAKQKVEDSLKKCHVTLDGHGESHEDPSALLRGERGNPVKVKLDLNWDTQGDPYTYRISTRYEIPCRVTGTITIDDEVFQFEGSPGQRDHSWGVRDWWSMDWVWNSLHLDDGTHIHGLDLRIPQMPRMFMGYIQSPQMPIEELTLVRSDEKTTDKGLVARSTLTITPHNLILDIEPQGHGPLRLAAGDGKVAMFPRWWAKVTTQDGRTGVGWLELNHNPKQ